MNRKQNAELRCCPLLPQAGEGLGKRDCEHMQALLQIDTPHSNPSPACGRGTLEGLFDMAFVAASYKLFLESFY